MFAHYCSHTIWGVNALGLLPQEPELEGIVEEQGPKPADGAGPATTENGQGSKPADDEPEKAWYKDPLVCPFSAHKLLAYTL